MIRSPVATTGKRPQLNRTVSGCNRTASCGCAGWCSAPVAVLGITKIQSTGKRPVTTGSTGLNRFQLTIHTPSTMVHVNYSIVQTYCGEIIRTITRDAELKIVRQLFRNSTKPSQLRIVTGGNSKRSRIPSRGSKSSRL